MLTVAEAAQALGVTPSTLRTAIQKGRLHAVPLTPRLNMVPRSEVERYRQESLGHPGPKRKRKEDG
jgi:excisionase family DNA binding protein